MTTFTSEAQFEQALIDELKNKGWDSQVLKNPTEADLLIHQPIHGQCQVRGN